MGFPHQELVETQELQAGWPDIPLNRGFLASANPMPLEPQLSERRRPSAPLIRRLEKAHDEHFNVMIRQVTPLPGSLR